MLFIFRYLLNSPKNVQGEMYKMIFLNILLCTGCPKTACGILCNPHSSRLAQDTFEKGRGVTRGVNEKE